MSNLPRYCCCFTALIFHRRMLIEVSFFPVFKHQSLYLAVLDFDLK